MAIGSGLLIVAVIFIALWLFIEMSHIKHKIFLFLLIALLLFTYFSAYYVIKEQNIDLSTSEGLIDASKIYFSWLGGMFENVKILTSNAVNLDWKKNETAESSGGYWKKT